MASLASWRFAGLFLMKQNLGGVERIGHMIVGLVLLALVVVGPRTWWGLLGVVPLVSGLWGW